MKRVRQSKSVENHSSPYGSVLFWRTGKLRLGRLEGGAVLPLVVASMFALAFMAGLAIDAGRAYTSREEVQAAADAAALAATQARQKGAINDDAETVARNVAAAHGFTDGVNGVKVDVELSDKDGKKLVRVVISREQATFIDYGNISALNPSGSSLAGVGPSPPIDSCLTILSSAADSINMGNSDIENPKSNCGIRTMGGIEAKKNNSAIKDFRAVTACGDGPPTGVVSGQTQEAYDLADLGDEKEKATYCEPKLVGIPSWSFSSCDRETKRLVVDNKNNKKIYGPGVYCGGIEVKGVTLSLSGGEYIIYGQGLALRANSKIVCPSPCTGGVVIRNDGDKKKAPYGSIEFDKTASVDLSPRSDGPYKGFLFVQPPENAEPINIRLKDTPSLKGNLYAPSAVLTFDAANTVVSASSITALSLVLPNANTFTLELDPDLYKTEETMSYPTPVLHE